MAYIGSTPTTAAFPFDQFSGTGSQTAFTLTYAPAGTTSIIVTVSGVVQNPNTYSTVGTTLTFTGAPPSGTNNVTVLYLGLPAIGVASPGNTAYQTAQDFTATASQTTFTTAGTYTVGFVNVYRNGLRLGDADFTATTTTTVVLGTACNAGDLVTVVYFTLTSITNAMPQSGGTFTGNIAVPTGTLYPLVSGTAVTASGTSVDFNSIPSTAKRITVMFSGVSTNGTSNWLIRLGTSGGVVTSGYAGAGSYNGASNAGANSTAGFIFIIGGSAQLMHGSMAITLLDASTNRWVEQGILGDSSQAYCFFSGGSVALSGVLDRVRITTVSGTDTFDAGTVNIMWEQIMTQAAVAASNAGLMTTPSGTAPNYMARAWVNFNGTGTVAIRASGNVSSITDNGTGDYTVNFTVAMSDANFSASGAGSADGAGSSGIGFSVESRSTTTVRVRVFVTTTANGSDQPAVLVSVFR